VRSGAVARQSDAIGSAQILLAITANTVKIPSSQDPPAETPGKPLDWRVEKMKLSKDKRSLIYNDFLTLSGIPPGVFEYRLGNRSALEWIIDQYQVSTDKRSAVTNNPNHTDVPQDIVKLIGSVITVSVEIVVLVRQLAQKTLLRINKMMSKFECSESQFVSDRGKRLQRIDNKKGGLPAPLRSPFTSLWYQSSE
jgi:hypothetical protein